MSFVRPRRRAHPRSRGDHILSPAPVSRFPGSSPLARGPRLSRRRTAILRGLIPARAGTTNSVFHLWRVDGSSPLARGPLQRKETLIMAHGLIPARAGTTVSDSPRKRHVRAHPRSRGDHDRTANVFPLNPGSSPLARGPPRTRHGGRYPPGLIPARAGTTCRRIPWWLLAWAHPRSRGDHPIFSPPLNGCQGSSPLARGPPRVSSEG